MPDNTGPKKKKFIVTAEVTEAQGWQSLIVEADSEAEAVELAERGEGEFYAEEIEVRRMDKFQSEGELEEEPEDGRFVINTPSGHYWTGSCWGVRQAAAEYRLSELAELTLDSDCTPGTFFCYQDTTSVDIGWGDEAGTIFASASLVK